MLCSNSTLYIYCTSIGRNVYIQHITTAMPYDEKKCLYTTHCIVPHIHLTSIQVHIVKY